MLSNPDIVEPLEALPLVKAETVNVVAADAFLDLKKIFYLMRVLTLCLRKS